VVICRQCGCAVPATLYCLNCGKLLEESKTISAESDKPKQIKQATFSSGGKLTEGFGGYR